MNYTEVFKESPNKSGVLQPTGIVLHHSAGNFVGSEAWILSPKSKVSYHCLVNTNGNRTILVPDNKRAWHAGVSSFKGKQHCNNFLLGIAVTGNTGKRLLNEDEINSVAEWCVAKMKLYNFGIDRITTHREICPGRKADVDPRAEKSIKEMILEMLNNNH
jgi:N-acetyl-anhydromuramoyl-L-alanine amidase